ncbi:hypothetical protein NQ317_000217 [Molorchus minor]|uniref:Uncharacterized protein n=1 Tax=Molorchus minor TaxID=1323400 RepID=A0ABQ9JH93_9CUCU|nr:hypothetical protein NQ317_000217 [Molorchus minor]
MVKSCRKCGKSNKKNKDVTLFSIPVCDQNPKWQMDLAKCLGVKEFSEKEVHLCSSHFKPEDIEMQECMWLLKENALPTENDADPAKEMVVKQEVVYLKCENDDDNSNSDCDGSKELAPLEPLVEYVYGEGEVNVSEVKVEETDDDSVRNVVQCEYGVDDAESQIISVVSAEGDEGMDPIMPFFLTSSPMFTILNENNEVGETIIVQIENSDENGSPAPEQIPNSQHYTEVGKDSEIVIDEYTCDICNNSYDCLNCLKSHYESLHIFSTPIRYICTHSHHISKNLVCPVCDLTFATRTETLDHYITHSVACDICGSGFDRYKHLADHYKQAHPKSGLERTYECDLCKTAYQNAAGLGKHYQIFHKMVLCHVCKKRFHTVHELQEHEEVHREKLDVLPFACSKCDKAFPRISDIAIHIRMDHKKKPAEDMDQAVCVNRVQIPLKKKVKVKK